MKIDIRQIPQDGVLSLSEEQDSKELNLDTEGLKFISPLKIDAEVKKDIGIIKVKSFIYAKAKGICSRCLKEYDFLVEKKFNFGYSIESEDEVLDIGEDLRQEIILDYPVSILCKKDCRGLCPKCGKNLNEGKCNCLK